MSLIDAQDFAGSMVLSVKRDSVVKIDPEEGIVINRRLAQQEAQYKTGGVVFGSLASQALRMTVSSSKKLKATTPSALKMLINGSNSVDYIWDILQADPKERSAKDLEMLEICTLYLSFFREMTQKKIYKQLGTHRKWLKRLKCCSFKKGKCVIRHGDPPDRIYIAQKGTGIVLCNKGNDQLKHEAQFYETIVNCNHRDTDHITSHQIQSFFDNNRVKFQGFTDLFGMIDFIKNGKVQFTNRYFKRNLLDIEKAEIDDYSNLFDSKTGLLKYYYANSVKTGEEFGEVGLIQNKPRTATIQSNEEEFYCAYIDKNDYKEVQKEAETMIHNKKLKFFNNEVFHGNTFNIDVENSQNTSLEHIIYKFNKKHYTRGHILYKQNEPAGFVYVIKVGVVKHYKLLKSDETVGEGFEALLKMKPCYTQLDIITKDKRGEFIGECEIFQDDKDGRRDSFAVCEDECDLWEVPFEIFKNLCQNNASFAAYMKNRVFNSQNNRREILRLGKKFRMKKIENDDIGWIRSLVKGKQEQKPSKAEIKEHDLLNEKDDLSKNDNNRDTGKRCSVQDHNSANKRTSGNQNDFFQTQVSNAKKNPPAIKIEINRVDCNQQNYDKSFTAAGGSPELRNNLKKSMFVKSSHKPPENNTIEAMPMNVISRSIMDLVNNVPSNSQKKPNENSHRASKVPSLQEFDLNNNKDDLLNLTAIQTPPRRNSMTKLDAYENLNATNLNATHLNTTAYTYGGNQQGATGSGGNLKVNNINEFDAIQLIQNIINQKNDDLDEFLHNKNLKSMKSKYDNVNNTNLHLGDGEKPNYKIDSELKALEFFNTIIRDVFGKNVLKKNFIYQSWNPTSFTKKIELNKSQRLKDEFITNKTKKKMLDDKLKNFDIKDLKNYLNAYYHHKNSETANEKFSAPDLLRIYHDNYDAPQEYQNTNDQIIPGTFFGGGTQDWDKEAHNWILPKEKQEAITRTYSGYIAYLNRFADFNKNVKKIDLTVLNVILESGKEEKEYQKQKLKGVISSNDTLATWQNNYDRKNSRDLDHESKGHLDPLKFLDMNKAKGKLFGRQGSIVATKAGNDNIRQGEGTKGICRQSANARRFKIFQAKRCFLNNLKKCEDDGYIVKGTIENDLDCYSLRAIKEDLRVPSTMGLRPVSVRIRDKSETFSEEILSDDPLVQINLMEDRQPDPLKILSAKKNQEEKYSIQVYNLKSEAVNEDQNTNSSRNFIQKNLNNRSKSARTKKNSNNESVLKQTLQDPWKFMANKKTTEICIWRTQPGSSTKDISDQSNHNLPLKDDTKTLKPTSGSTAANTKTPHKKQATLDGSLHSSTNRMYSERAIKKEFSMFNRQKRNTQKYQYQQNPNCQDMNVFSGEFYDKNKSDSKIVRLQSAHPNLLNNQKYTDMDNMIMSAEQIIYKNSDTFQTQRDPMCRDIDSILKESAINSKNMPVLLKSDSQPLKRVQSARLKSYKTSESVDYRTLNDNANIKTCREKMIDGMIDSWVDKRLTKSIVRKSSQKAILGAPNKPDMIEKCFRKKNTFMAHKFGDIRKKTESLRKIRGLPAQVGGVNGNGGFCLGGAGHNRPISGYANRSYE